MSTGNVELVRSIFSAWGQGDFGSAPWAHPDIEAAIADGPEPVVAHGLADMARGWGDLLRAWEGFRSEPEEFRELDSERVLVLTRFSGRGRTSGVDLAQIHPRGALLFELRDGRVTRAVHYFDRDRALRELGLA